MTLSLRPDGTLTDPSFHDGAVTGVEVDGGRATITLKDWTGARWRLKLSGVEHLVASDFREGNIISHVEVLRGLRPRPEYLAPIFPEPHPAVTEPYREAHRRRVERAGDRIAAGEVTMVSITPSYGCDLVAICDAVELVRVEAGAT